MNVISFGIFGFSDDTFICITVNVNPLKTNNRVRRECRSNGKLMRQRHGKGEKPTEMFVFCSTDTRTTEHAVVSFSSARQHTARGESIPLLLLLLPLLLLINPEKLL